MGIQLVGRALVHWAPHISDRAFRVLIRMACTALDQEKDGQPPNIFFGGRDLLAMSFRAERGGTDESTHRTVRRAVVELVDVGAIERVVEAKRGTNGVYRLLLDAVPKTSGLRTPESGIKRTPDPELRTPGSGVPDSGVRNKTDSGLQGSKPRTPADPPRNKEEQPNPQENTKEEVVDLRTAVTVVCAPEAIAENPIDPLPPKCPHGLTARRHPDGTSSCALCRRTERQSPNVLPFRRPA